MSAARSVRLAAIAGIAFVVLSGCGPTELAVEAATHGAGAAQQAQSAQQTKQRVREQLDAAQRAGDAQRAQVEKDSQ